MRLWVAPRRDGGFCFAIYHAGASCVPPDFTPLWVNQRGFTRSGIALEFAGTITDPRATTIEANYKDGSHDDVPFIYVSPPINAGFFIFGVPNEHLSHESELVAVTALDQNGHVLAREPITFH
jgi:hypothetical protein